MVKRCRKDESKAERVENGERDRNKGMAEVEFGCGARPVLRGILGVKI